MSFKLSSSSFLHGQNIPTEFTCEGQDISPALAWNGAPQGTRTFVLIVDDPDAPDPAAPKMTWVHWVLFNLPGSTTELPSAIASADLPAETVEGLNDWKRTGYGGPCPPIGRHRYFFKLYAIDAELGLPSASTKTAVEAAMKGHILAETQLLGTYQKQQTG